MKSKPIQSEQVLMGYLPPQAIELEQAVIGACLVENFAFNEIAQILKPHHFYKAQNEQIFQAMQNLFARNSKIDILTVFEELRKMGEAESVGGLYYLTQLTSTVGSSAHIVEHAAVVKERWMQREINTFSMKIQRKSCDVTNDVFDIIDEAVSFFNTLNDTGEPVKRFEDVVQESLTEVLSEADKTATSALTTGFKPLDEKIKGFVNSDLIIIAARPSEGKTTLAIQAALEQAKQGVPVGILSMEMKQTQLAKKMLFSLSGLPFNGSLSVQEMEILGNAAKRLKSLPIYIYERAGLNINEVSAIAKGWKYRHNIGCLIIDYLQLMDMQEVKGGTRDQAIGNVTRKLKVLAKNLNIPVILLSQLSRDLEKRGAKDKRPMLSDLRESGNIEQDADMVLMLFRPDRHGILEYEDGKSTANVAEILVRKYRMGDLCTVLSTFRGAESRFDVYNELPMPSSFTPMKRSFHEAEKDFDEF